MTITFLQWGLIVQKRLLQAKASPEPRFEPLQRSTEGGRQRAVDAMIGM